MEVGGREQVIDSVVARLTGTDRSSAPVVIVGEAGAGASTVMWAAVERSGLRCVEVAVAPAGEAPLAAIGSIAAAVLARFDGIPAAAADALERTLGTAQLDAVAGALAAVLTAPILARSSVIAIDDAHLLDEASARVLRAVLGRPGRGPVRRPSPVVATARAGSRCWLDGLTDPVRLGPLTEAECRTLGARLRLAPVVADELRRRSAGNPLAFTTMARSLGPLQRSSHEPLPDVLSPGRRMVEAVRAGPLAAVTPAARQALLTVAIAEAAGRHSLLSALLGKAGRAALAGDPAARAVLTEAGTGFRDPLVLATVWEQATSSARRAAHGVLAQAIGPEAPEAYALQLGASPAPPSHRTAAFEAAARAAAARGAMMTAARFFERAAEVAEDPAQQADHWSTAALLHTIYGELAMGAHVAARALEVIEEPERRVFMEAALLQARWAEVGSPTTRAALLDLVERARSVAAEHAAFGVLSLAHLDVADGRWDRALETGRLGTEIVDGVPGTEAHQLGFTIISEFSERALGEPRETPAVETVLSFAKAGFGLADDQPPEHVATSGDPTVLYSYAAFTALADEHWADAGEVLERLHRRNRHYGWHGLVGDTVVFWAEYLWRTGRWAEATEACAEVYELYRSRSDDPRRAWVAAAWARLEAGQGNTGRAFELAEEATRWNATLQLGGVEAWTRLARSMAARMERRAEEAVEELQAVKRWAAGSVVHPGFLWWQAELASALVDLGDRDAAWHEASMLLATAEVYRLPVARAMAQRGRALARPDAAGEELAEAVATLAAGPARFEWARAVSTQAELAAGDPPKAARLAHQAAGLHAAVGSRPWQHRAEALAARLRPATLDGFSERELEVAAHAARGRSNKEIATALNLSVKTVEFHLSNAYRKSGVRSRAELVRRMASLRSR